MKTVTGTRTPADDYESHLERFLTAAQDLGDNTELSMLRETIFNLWRQNHDLVRTGHTDPLTGVLNRRGLSHATSSLAHLAQRSGGTVGVLMADIDHFKAINDKFGHQAGDAVLAAVGPALKAAIRHSDVTGRYGGEEFLVFMPGIVPGALADVGEMIRHRVHEATAQVTPVTISIGGAEGTISGDPQAGLDDLIAAADEALYAAKGGGRNRVVIADLPKQSKFPRLKAVANSK
jgi:diguanylate cyclase (GGDEF)-like protein